ncbi:MAG: EamA family transporter [Burkholderiales bacterium]|nr:EamA family transporter [Burkholderiales bacterium]
MPVRLSLRDLLLILLVVTIWGFTFVPMRWALDSVPPFALAALRFLFAALPAVFFIRRPNVRWRTLVAYGMAIGVFQFGMLFLGIRLGMPAGLSSLVIQTQVFFTIGLAAWWLHDRLDRHSLIGAAVAAVGIVVLAWHKLALGAAATFVGFVLVIGAALAWAVGNVIAKRAAANTNDGDVDMLGLVVWSSLAAPVPLALASSVFEGGGRAWDAVVGMTWQPWACVLFMSYFGTLFGLVTWNAQLHRYPTAVIAPFALLIPVAGLGSGAIFLGEGLAPVQFGGVALVLAGLVYNVFGAQARSWLARSLD